MRCRRAHRSRFSFSCELGDGRAALLNTITGAIDVVADDLVRGLEAPATLAPRDRARLAARGHLWTSAHDEARVMARLGTLLRGEARKARPLKLVLVTSYRCNLRCQYCWQRGDVAGLRRVSFDDARLEAALRAFDRLARDHAGDTSGVEVQLFGGEPLLAGNEHVVRTLLEHARARGWRTHVTTNGMRLLACADLFRAAPPSEVQVTLDGDARRHEARRRGSDFEQIAAGVEELLFRGESFVKIRTNLDLDTVEGLPALADVLIDRRWFTNPMFMAYVSPTRDSRLTERRRFDERVALLARYLEVKREHPQVEVLQVRGWPGYSEFRTVADTGRFPQPTFRSCEANDATFVLDPQGLLFACNETNGDPARRVGRFWPRFGLRARALETWRTPVAARREACSCCPLMPLCGGGCAQAATGTPWFEGFCANVRATFSWALREHVLRKGLS